VVSTSSQPFLEAGSIFHPPNSRHPSIHAHVKDQRLSIHEDVELPINIKERDALSDTIARTVAVLKSYGPANIFLNKEKLLDIERTLNQFRYSRITIKHF